MRSDHAVPQDEAEGPEDPSGLPLFAPPPSPARGRVRSTFTLSDRLAAAAEGRSSRAGQPFRVVRTPAPARPAPAPAPVPRPVDWSVVAVLRSQASDRLSVALGEGRDRLGPGAQRELGRAVILELIQAELEAHLAAGRDAWTRPEQDALAVAVFDALFGLGRLQPLVDDDRVENIVITGCDRVWLELADGRMLPSEPIADTDEELIDFLVFLASRSEVNARPFSPARPRLHLRLDGGARLA